MHHRMAQTSAGWDDAMRREPPYVIPADVFQGWGPEVSGAAGVAPRLWALLALAPRALHAPHRGVRKRRKALRLPPSKIHGLHQCIAAPPSPSTTTTIDDGAHNEECRIQRFGHPHTNVRIFTPHNRTQRLRRERRYGASGGRGSRRPAAHARTRPPPRTPLAARRPHPARPAMADPGRGAPQMAAHAGRGWARVGGQRAPPCPP